MTLWMYASICEIVSVLAVMFLWPLSKRDFGGIVPPQIARWLLAMLVFGWAGPIWLPVLITLSVIVPLVKACRFPDLWRGED